MLREPNDVREDVMPIIWDRVWQVRMLRSITLTFFTFSTFLLSHGTYSRMKICDIFPFRNGRFYHCVIVNVNVITVKNFQVSTNNKTTRAQLNVITMASGEVTRPKPLPKSALVVLSCCVCLFIVMFVAYLVFWLISWFGQCPKVKVHSLLMSSLLVFCNLQLIERKLLVCYYCYFLNFQWHTVELVETMHQGSEKWPELLWESSLERS